MTGHVDWQAEFARHVEQMKAMTLRRLYWLRCRADIEDAIADVLALAWRKWQRRIAAGGDPRNWAVKIGACALADVMRGKAAQGSCAKSELLSQYNQCHRGYHVATYDHRAGRSDRQFCNALLTGRQDNPGAVARAAVDWEDWIASLCTADKQLVREMMQGDTNTQLAARRGFDRKWATRKRRQLAAQWADYGVNPK